MPALGYEFYLQVFNSLLYKQQHQGYFSNFPNISEHFPKISEDFSKLSEQCPKFIRTLPIIFRKFPKMSEDFRRLPKVSEQSSKMFRSHRNEFRFFRQLNLIAHATSLLSSHVKISNLCSHLKISCFHSKRNPCNSLKFIS